MVELDRELKISSKMMCEAQSGIGASHAWIDRKSSAVPLDGVVEVTFLSVSVTQIENGRLARLNVEIIGVLRYL